MAGDTQLVGPFPPGEDYEAYDRRRRRVMWSMPSGIYVLGVRAGVRRNLMTLNWATQVASAPKLVAVGVETAAFTHELLVEGRCFSLNILAREDRAIVRKFAKPVADDGDASMLGGFAVHTASTGAPILDTAATWLDCSVTDVVPLGSHTLFIGEVQDCGDVGDDLEVLRMEDTRMNYGG